ncbi:CER3 [Symbiodinium microadriaticum]|nr:CER3 [Symbiodinium microadriaticum]
MAFAALQVSVTVIVLTALMFNMFRGSQSSTWWGRYLVYPATYVLAVQVGATHMLPMLIAGTLLRYLVNLLFTALSKLDTFAEPVRIHRTNPPAEQHERELDWDGPVILSPTAFVLVDAVTPWLRTTVPLSWSNIAVCFLAHYLVVEPLYYLLHRWLHTPAVYKASHVHHHSSVVTEAISGTSHPMLETLGYLANFSFPSLEDFRRQLLDVYPDSAAVRFRHPEHPGTVVLCDDRTALLPSESPADATASRPASVAQKVTSPIGRQSTTQSSGRLARKESLQRSLPSGSAERAVQQRLQLRLGARTGQAMMSAEDLHDAVVSLGLTRYTEQDTAVFLNQLADYIQLRYDDAPHRNSSSRSLKRECFREVGWVWPSQETEQSLEVEVSMSLSLPSSLQGQPNAALDTLSGSGVALAPVEALMRVFLAEDRDIARRKIFDSRCIKQYKAMKEILLASDTNRLVAELTFVRINDLAAPPEEALQPLTYLEPLVAIMILGNAVAIGFQSDPEYSDWSGWTAVEAIFAGWLLIEIVLRSWLVGCFDYLYGEERLWNSFDICVAIVAGLDVFVYRIGLNEATGLYGTWLIRIFRLIRLVRVMRVFRLRLMRDLRLMVKGLLAGVWTLVLSFLLLFLILYVVAGFATIFIGNDAKLQDLGLQPQFRTVPDSMFTAFRCFTGDCNSDSGAPMASLLAATYGVPFIFGFVSSYLLVALGIFNVILAVYVDITMKAAKETEALTAEQHFRESIRVARTTRELLKRFAAAHRWLEQHKDEDHREKTIDIPETTKSSRFSDEDVHEDLAINKECFLMAIQDREVQHLMNQLDLPPDRANLFEIIDADDSGALHIAELVHGLLKVRGEVKKSDTVAALLATKSVQEMVHVSGARLVWLLLTRFGPSEESSGGRCIVAVGVAPEIPIYFVFFDIMNCIGHCNFECMPTWAQAGSRRKYKYNYCLFCPIWDYLGGTVHPTTESLHQEVLHQKSRQLDVVFLAHGHGLHSMLHLPWLSPFLASHQHEQRWWMLPLQPLTFLWVLFCRHCLSTACVQRYHYRSTQCATWCLPVTGHFYFMKSHRKPIFDMLVQAVKDADDAGVKYLGLAHLNKAEFLNQGGKDLLPLLGDRKIRIVHGNTLTAAAVWQALQEHTQPKDEIVFAGSTSKIGRALCILLARRGHTVRMITGCEERFQKIKGEAGEFGKNLVRVQTYEEGVGCGVWILGKWMEPKRIQALIPPSSLIIDFAVPHVSEEVAKDYRYVNGAALSYSLKETDLTFCHDVPNTVPACMAAAVIHAREDTQRHELGEVEVDEVEGWWDKASRHGFRLAYREPKGKRAPGPSGE